MGYRESNGSWVNDTEFSPGNILQNTDSLFPCRIAGAEIEEEQNGRIAGESLESQQETGRKVHTG